MNRTAAFRFCLLTGSLYFLGASPARPRTSNDDWVETVSPSGQVVYKYEIGGYDPE
jgi:hypothetical protein